jgi:hypothetical protein
MNTRTFAAAFLLALGLATLAYAGAETCFYQSDSTSGQNKTCLYSCPSGSASITIKSYALCPLNIQR